MSDAILLDGDVFEFPAAFLPTATMLAGPPQGKMKASGKATVEGKKVCVKGDEKNVKVENLAYTAGPFSVPGKGTAELVTLIDQVGLFASSGGKKVLLKGTQFIAKFQVQTPAKLVTPAGETPDPVPQYIGFGRFQTGNQ